MFSKLSEKVLQLFFTYFLTWNTPFDWNKNKKELQLTRNKSQILRWKALSACLCLNTVFIYIRTINSYVSDKVNVSMNELVLQIPHLVIYSIVFCAVLTIWFRAEDVAYAFNQIEKNQNMTRKFSEQKKWDMLGIILSFYFLAGVLFPYIAACFFFFNRTSSIFLYSLVNTGNQTELEQGLVFLGFLVLEVASFHNLTNMGVVVCIAVCTFYTHVRSMLTLTLDSAEETYRKFQVLKLHTARFNEAYASFILAPVKDLTALLLVMTVFALIRYEDELSFISFLLLSSAAGIMTILCFTIFYPAGWVWQYSMKIKSGFRVKGTLEKLIVRSLGPFGIMIGSLYVMKTSTVMSLCNIVLTNIGTLLIAFKH